MAASAADAAAVNCNGIKTLLANGLSILFVNRKLTLANEGRVTNCLKLKLTYCC